MNVWESIKLECYQLFKFKPEIFQLRLWWYGAPKLAERNCAHKKKVEAALISWDVVIKLALRYTKTIIAKEGRRWSDLEIVKYVYWLVWSEYEQTVERKNKDNTIFNAFTFWNWALEHKNSVDSVITQKGAKSFKTVLKNMLNEL